MTPLERALAHLEAVMHQPPPPPNPDTLVLVRRLLEEVVRLVEENRRLRDRVRELSHVPTPPGQGAQACSTHELEGQ
jgi:hypothetical protein